MRINLLILLSIFLTINSFAADKSLISDTTKQHKPRNARNLPYPSPPKSAKEQDSLFNPIYSNCVFINRYNLNTVSRKYPFSKAAKIIAISYHAFKPKTPGGGYEIKADTLDRSTIVESKTLTQKQINQFITIVYNTDFNKPGYNVIKEFGCFEPRNALVFIDKNGKVYDYIEICFACREFSSKSEKLNLGIQCTQKYELVRKYFRSMGILFGTKKNMEPGDDRLPTH